MRNQPAPHLCVVDERQKEYLGHPKRVMGPSPHWATKARVAALEKEAPIISGCKKNSGNFDPLHEIEGYGKP